ncbi:hypothetical protein OS493_033217 [Desmophyllum pertusum]|uniref:Uncharacterized protein n=1 Tax=Desmophyllum pertusum TaxID=174260 RepID=A0A9W9Y846_9CNID|nr:hypothetical protein OS493_033217 [Desmophyllum pertusum]
MDKGHVLLDRFLISVPLALKPTPEEEEQPTEYLADLSFKGFQPVFKAIADAHNDIIRTYSLDLAAAELHRQLKTDHVNEVNAAIQNGDVPPKSKSTDLVTRVAVALSTVTYAISAMLDEQRTNNPPEKTVLEKVNGLHSVPPFPKRYVLRIHQGNHRASH